MWYVIIIIFINFKIQIKDETRSQSHYRTNTIWTTSITTINIPISSTSGIYATIRSANFTTTSWISTNGTRCNGTTTNGKRWCITEGWLYETEIKRAIKWYLVSCMLDNVWHRSVNYIYLDKLAYVRWFILVWISIM